MGKIKEIYKHNIYGVITTLVFHILIFLFLILTRLTMGDRIQKDAIVLDLTEMDLKIPEPEKEKKQQPEPAISQQQKSCLLYTSPSPRD